MKWFAGKADFVIREAGIDTIEKVTLGGVEQHILLQGNDLSKPVLLFLHGGPSMPLPGISSRGKDYTIATNTKELVNHYIVVFWDQRGTGKSYHPSIPRDSMTISSFVADTIALTDYLRERFDRPKIFLAGHSWGSIIGLMAASRHPDKYYSYVGLSQIVSWTDNDHLGLAWAREEAARRNNRKAMRELEAVGEPPYTESFRQWGVLRKWQRNFGSMVYTDAHIDHPGLQKMALDMLRAKDYTWKDMYNSFVKGFKLVYTEDFIRSLPEIDFARSVPRVSLPVTFIHGTKDVHVHGSLVEQYVDKLEAERGKRMIWLDKSAHVFHPDDTKRIEQLLIAESGRVAANF